VKNLTLKQAEQLIILIEECAEVQKECSKLLRFGKTDEYGMLDNLTQEIGDLLGIIEWVQKEFDINPELLIQYGQMKQNKMMNHTSYQK
jgi:NTP pyrophosphatase (non-canonical NTP hydrolase)